MRSKGDEHDGSRSLNLDGIQGNEKGSQGIKIELRNVWFKYPTRDAPVLKGVNITVSLSESNGTLF